MSEAYIIEIDDLAAGIVERERGGFRFRAAHRDFYRLEGRHFATPYRAQHAAEELMRTLTLRRARHAVANEANARLQAKRPPDAAARSCWGLTASAVPPAALHLDMPR